MFVIGYFINVKGKTMKKLIVASALAFTTLAGLATSPKVQASSTTKSAKVSFKQYKINKKYKNGLKAKYYFNLPHLKGKSAAIKKINKDLLKKYKSSSYTTSKGIFRNAKDVSEGKLSSGGFFTKNCTYYDITKTSVSYNKNGVVSFKVYYSKWGGARGGDDGSYVGGNKRAYVKMFTGWTYSLKSGKTLGIFDTAKGNKTSIQKKLDDGVTKYLGAETGELPLNYYLKNGKLYVYPYFDLFNWNNIYAKHNPPIYYNSHFTIPSRYK